MKWMCARDFGRFCRCECNVALVRKNRRLKAHTGGQTDGHTIRTQTHSIVPLTRCDQYIWFCTRQTQPAGEPSRHSCSFCPVCRCHCRPQPGSDLRRAHLAGPKRTRCELELDLKSELMLTLKAVHQVATDDCHLCQRAGLSERGAQFCPLPPLAKQAGAGSER